MEPWWSDIDRGKLKNLEKSLTQCHFVTTKPTWIDPGVNPGLCVEGSAAKHLNHGTTHSKHFYRRNTITVKFSLQPRYINETTADAVSTQISGTTIKFLHSHLKVLLGKYRNFLVDTFLLFSCGRVWHVNCFLSVLVAAPCTNFVHMYWNLMS
jgi:hypothetical protein